MRRPSVARIEEAAAESTRASSACSAATPMSASRVSHFSPDGRVGGGKRPFVEQRLDVHHRAADDDRYRPFGRDPLDVGGRILLVAGDGRRLGDVQHVELVVRDAAAVGDGQLRGPDVHPAVELHGVGVHDLTAEPFGHRQRQRRLPGTGRTDDRERPHGCQTPAKYPTPYGAPR